MNQKNSTCIDLKNIYKSFNTKKVLEGVTLSLEPGSIFGLIGLNGAGKTTLIRILLGLVNPDRGECTVLDMNPAQHSKKYYRQVGVVLEHSGFFGNLTLQENLAFFAEARGISHDQLHEYFQSYWAQSAIGKDGRKIKYFSRGQKMQCALCRAFLGWPKVYFFDEPAVALDIYAYDQFFELVHQAQSLKATIVISSHQLDAIEELCTSIGILEKGRLTIIEDLYQKKVKETWLIKVDYKDEYKTIIDEIGETSSAFSDGEWVFSLVSKHTEKTIAKIISQLVYKGASIREVRPKKEEFRKSIRYHMHDA